MSKFVVPVQLEVESSNGATGARLIVQNALRAGVEERLIVSGKVTGEPEECVCLTTSELTARINEAVAAATSKAPSA